MTMHNGVANINQIGKIINGKPQFWCLFIYIPKNGTSNNESTNNINFIMRVQLIT